MWQQATGAYDDAIRVESQARAAAVAGLQAAYRMMPDFLADSAKSATVVAGTPGLADEGGKYQIGPPTRPDLQALGDHQIYGTSDVVITGNQATMTIKVHAEDMYNFNSGAADIATGAPDNENGRFSTLGWAKGFATHGELERTVTWTIGQSDTTATTSGATSPQRDVTSNEDRADSRG